MKILLVDDDTMLRNAVTEMLEGKGYEVTVASNGTEGLRASKEGAFDVIVSDFNMPYLNGLEFYEALEPGMQKRFILCSGSIDAMRKAPSDLTTLPKSSLRELPSTIQTLLETLDG